MESSTSRGAAAVVKDLIERWRKRRETNHKYTVVRRDYSAIKCADELEAYLKSLWTEITDDPATWPEDGRDILTKWPDERVPEPDILEANTDDLAEGAYRGWVWRYWGIEGIDTP